MAIKGAQPGDVLEVRILDVKMLALPKQTPGYSRARLLAATRQPGGAFTTRTLIEEPKPREVITIYEVDATGERDCAKAVYNFRWYPPKDPFAQAARDHRLPRRAGEPPHRRRRETGRHPEERARRRPGRISAVMGLAPKEADMVDSIPPSYTGGNIDNWRIGKGATMYLPGVGAGRPVLRRGSACLAGRLRAVWHGHRMLAHRHISVHPAPEGKPRRYAALEKLDYPLLETQTSVCCTASAIPTTWRSSGAKAQTDISTPNPRSTWRCATPSARCGIS